MNGTVLVSTHSLPAAGRLRDGFRDAGYRVELVTPGEVLEVAEEPQLLVLTGDLRGEGAASLVRQARETLGIPVFGIRDADVEGDGGAQARTLASDVGLTELFPPRFDPEEVAFIGRRLIERRRLQRLTGIVGETDVMREVLERVVQIAPVPSTVLVTGESGTGKELVARGIHALSPRRHRPFMAINVAAIPDTLLESELFGHEKGAFTGAIDARRGFFELAQKGTLFLDEIGEMPLATQTKLLRVLEQREFLRVGGESPIRVDVRIVAATNRDLRQLVADGEFRRDLYYRVNVLSIELPPLRERRDDIPLLANAFIREVSTQLDRPFPGISDAAMERLKAHHWPGNVRELRNLIESMVVLAPGREIRAEDIPSELDQRRPGTSLLPVPTRLPAAPEAARGRLPAPEGRGPSDASLRPELEFIFRTLVELRVDMDQLQSEFEAYRNDLREVGKPEPSAELSRWEGREAAVGIGGTIRAPEGAAEGASDAREGPDGGGSARTGSEAAEGGAESSGDGPATERVRGREEEDAVVFRPGMTMEEMEREAIVAVLRKTKGNRRKAAALLDIGERTLYRKIRRFELDE